MQMEFVRKLPIPQELKAQYPLPESIKQLKQKRATPEPAKAKTPEPKPEQDGFEWLAEVFH